MGSGTRIGRRSAAGTIIAAWLVAGTLDICAAFVQVYLRGGKNPLIVLNYIAGAVFGKERANTGGTPMMVAGLLFHYLAAFLFTLFFYWLYPRVKFFWKNRIVTALVYGVFVWVVMNLLVVPMTLIAKYPSDPKQAAIAAAILVGMIGLPLSLIIGSYYDNKRRSAT